MHALSIPTWIIHISSVIEWIAAIWLIWTYAEVTQNQAWRALSFGMLPALVSAMCACTWHLFDNAPELEWLVTLQAAMTVVGNITLCLAAWWIWRLALRTTPQEPPLQTKDK
ncbi:DUF2499 domain-containing protein [Leptolyngbya sp. FACHB-541]|uniref:DUF2499 domain-containing protein n=1 Tax=Leptolyngbya sp. FACHB-541 TaxID=2692810 RepID=UPI001688996E|nr:DUF2499 domain-containing protein [Leptolyngbya sp. FACHB-541]MBD1996306.1 DUF2499 domain-containing protein [Leptolyngbya sp. FACHB-541]